MSVAAVGVIAIFLLGCCETSAVDACCMQDGDCVFFDEQIESVDLIGVCDGGRSYACCTQDDDCAFFGEQIECIGKLTDTVSYDTEFHSSPHTISPHDPTEQPGSLLRAVFVVLLSVAVFRCSKQKS